MVLRSALIVFPNKIQTWVLSSCQMKAEQFSNASCTLPHLSVNYLPPQGDYLLFSFALAKERKLYENHGSIFCQIEAVAHSDNICVICEIFTDDIVNTVNVCVKHKPASWNWLQKEHLEINQGSVSCWIIIAESYTCLLIKSCLQKTTVSDEYSHNIFLTFQLYECVSQFILIHSSKQFRSPGHNEG